MTSRIAVKKLRISARSRRCLTVFAALSLFFLVYACGPAPPQKGTPAFYWSGAKETYAGGDYARTIDHLDNLLNSDNDYTARAYPWALLVTSGLASGYMDLADKYEAGAKTFKKGAAPTDFFRRISNYRSFANRMTLHFADTFARFAKTKDDPVTVAFTFPPGSGAPVPQLATVAQGGLLPVATADEAEKRALQRSILLAIVRAVGAPDDPPKGEQILKTSEGKVPRATFLLAMARTLYEEAQLYDRRKVNDSDKRMILCQRAQDVLKSLPESADTKALDLKIRIVLTAPRA